MRLGNRRSSTEPDARLGGTPMPKSLHGIRPATRPDRDGTIDVALGGQVHDCLRVEPRKQSAMQSQYPDVPVDSDGLRRSVIIRSLVHDEHVILPRPKNQSEVAAIASRLTKQPPERFDWPFTRRHYYHALDM